MVIPPGILKWRPFEILKVQFFELKIMFMREMWVSFVREDCPNFTILLLKFNVEPARDITAPSVASLSMNVESVMFRVSAFWITKRPPPITLLQFLKLDSVMKT